MLKQCMHLKLCVLYICFRITPFLPNWFINIVSPVIGVDLRPFWIGTFIGVAPPSFVAIQVRNLRSGFFVNYAACSFKSLI